MRTPNIEFIVPVALKEVMERLVPEYERAGNACFRIVHVLNPEVPSQIAKAGRWDIAITNPRYIDEIVEAGHADRSTCQPFARAPLAIAAKGIHDPPIRTVEGLTGILRSARSIALTDTGTSGDAFRHVLRSLGLWEDLCDRLLCMEGGGPMRAVLDDCAELAALPLTNIASVSGVSPVAICAPELGAHIDFSICVSPTANPVTRAFGEWLSREVPDERLAQLGAMRIGLPRSRP